MKYDQNRPVVALVPKDGIISSPIIRMRTMRVKLTTRDRSEYLGFGFGLLEFVPDLSEKFIALLACAFVFNSFG